ncbi:MAG: triose-phosphate isomerase, partial [Candidatus Omnitrophota bacterium]
RTIVAYEPLWAIGNKRAETPEQAQEMALFIRGIVQEEFGEQAARNIRIAYGNYVTKDNARSYLLERDIDGVILGGGGVKADDVKAVAETAQDIEFINGKKLYIGVNWKDFLIEEPFHAFVEALKDINQEKVQVAIAPSLAKIAKLSRAYETEEKMVFVPDLPIDILAQKVAPKRGTLTNAQTGEVYIGDATEEGIDGIIAGHSESRANFIRESDARINAQIRAAHERKLKIIILCVGETAKEKALGDSEKVLKSQVSLGLKGLTPEQAARTIVAYEPRWAIAGSGYGKPAEPQDAQDGAAFIRKTIEEKFGPEIAKRVIIQYGGSANKSNTKDYLSQPDVNGLLVGGKSTSLEEFIPMVKIAQEIGPTEGRVPHIYANWKIYEIKNRYTDFIRALKGIDTARVRVGIAPSLVKIERLAKARALVVMLEGLSNYVDECKALGKINETEARDTLARVEDWLSNPAYPQKLVNKLRELIAEKNWSLITQCFYRKVAFGTAGIRSMQVDAKGEVLPGTNVINDYTIAEYTLALARHLLKKGQADRGSILGGDTRIRSILPYRGEISYTNLEARIFRILEIKIYRFLGPRAIAQAARAVARYDAASMVYNSASHNKYDDNGVKATNEFTAQLFPDEREEILAEREQVTPEDIAALNLEEFDLEKDRKDNPDMHILLGGAQDKLEDPTVIDDDAVFIKENHGFAIRRDIIREYSGHVHSVFTPVHGVSIHTIPQLLNNGGDFNFNMHLYKEQAYQDPECRFPTVEKPDPNFVNLDTNVRTLDKAIEEAERIERERGVKIDFVFGLDPDADRVSFAVRNRAGDWVILRANDVWSLFAWYMLTQREDLRGKYIIKTWATTDLIRAIAEDPKFDLTVLEPAVGFNKIAEVALKEIALPIQAERRGVDLAKLRELKPLSLDGLVQALGASSRKEVLDEIIAILREYLAFGGEESNGIAPGGHTLEKDAATATLIFHEIAAYVKYINANKEEASKNDPYLKDYFKTFGNKDLTISGFLDRVYLEYGYFATANIALEFWGLDGMAQKEKVLTAMNELAEEINSKTTEMKVLGRPVANTISGSKYTSTEHVTFLELGYKYFLSLWDFFINRPSGTEPYIRGYGQLHVANEELTWGNIEDKKAEADALVEKMVKENQEIAKLRAGIAASPIVEVRKVSSPAIQQQAREVAGVDLSSITFKVIF